MSTERSGHSGTDNGVPETGPPGTIEGGPAIIPDAQPATSDKAARARGRAAEAGVAAREHSRKVTGAAGKATRRLTGHAAAWARRNPKAMAGAMAGAAAAGLAACRRITRRRQR